MEFDKTRVYTAVNADELKVGSKCIFADTIEELEDAVKNKQSAYISKVKRIAERGCIFRFVCENHSEHNLAYLLKEPKYKPFSSTEKAKEVIDNHGGWIEEATSGYKYLVAAYKEDGIGLFDEFVSLQELNERFVFADDGTPCGELVG